MLWLCKKKLKEEVYQLLKKIPKGKVSTYKILANTLDSKAYRYIGQVLKNNPHPYLTPCHRIISSNGHIGGFAYGIEEKIQLLEEEGVFFKNDFIVDFQDKLFLF